MRKYGELEREERSMEEEDKSIKREEEGKIDAERGRKKRNIDFIPKFSYFHFIYFYIKCVMDFFFKNEK